jgi:uncharacterized protein (DUF983 family)
MAMLEIGGKAADRREPEQESRNTGQVHQTRPAWTNAPIAARASCSAPISNRSTACAFCGEEMFHHRADDLPAYLAIFIVGHVVVAGFMATDSWLVLESWQHLMIWIPITVILSLALLQPIKGGVIGLQWSFRMHGFSGNRRRGHAWSRLARKQDECWRFGQGRSSDRRRGKAQ